MFDKPVLNRYRVRRHRLEKCNLNVLKEIFSLLYVLGCELNHSIQPSTGRRQIIITMTKPVTHTASQVDHVHIYTHRIKGLSNGTIWPSRNHHRTRGYKAAFAFSMSTTATKIR